MTEPRTSDSDPIHVDWLSIALPGKVGLTFAPGKQQLTPASGPAWQRDLGADLDRLRGHYAVDLLVPLLEDGELRELQIQSLVDSAVARGFDVSRFPIEDGRIPTNLTEFQQFVASVTDRARSGQNVVIHCKGGLGRAGTVGACVLIAAGASATQALELVAEARGSNAPETLEQREFVAMFANDGGRPQAPDRASRALGAVLGAAIGDAIGHPTEFIGSFEEIRRRYPPNGVTGYQLFWERDGQRFAPYTDDTQMAEVVLLGLLEGRDAELDLDATMQRIGAGFVEWSVNPQGGHRAPGNACISGSRALAQGVHWSEAGAEDAGGCGSVMRAYPFGLLFADDTQAAEAWAAAHSQLTHGAGIARAACAAIAGGVAAAMRGEDADEIAQALVDGARRQHERTAEMIETALDEARDGTEPEVTLSRLRGWAAHEAIAAAAYVFARHPDDARAGILEAANTPGDSDSIATLAGALLGAHLGVGSLPSSWSRDVERTDELQALAHRVIDEASSAGLDQRAVNEPLNGGRSTGHQPAWSLDERSKE